MKKYLSMLTIAVTVLLTGCAGTPQAPLSLNGDFWQSKDAKVGIVMTNLPLLDVYLPGASCLLCLAVAEGANSSLSTHTKSLDAETLNDVKEKIASIIRAKGMDVVVIDSPLNVKGLPTFKSELPNAARTNFGIFKTNHDITHLVAVEVTALGFNRSYSSYIPTSDPKGVFIGKTYLVNLETNTYELYEPITIYKAAAGEWSEKPAFPSLTNAYYQALETGKDAVIAPYTM